MASQRSASMSQWKEPDAVADKVLKRAEVSKVSRPGREERSPTAYPYAALARGMPPVANLCKRRSPGDYKIDSRWHSSKRSTAGKT